MNKFLAATFSLFLLATPCLAQPQSVLGPGPVVGLGPTTYTPTDTSGASLVFTSVSGVYTYQNHTVCVAASVTYPSTANGNSTAISLPIAASSSAPNQQLSIIAVGQTSPSGVVVANSSNILLANSTSTANVTNATVTGALVRFSGCYLTN